MSSSFRRWSSNPNPNPNPNPSPNPNWLPKVVLHRDAPGDSIFEYTLDAARYVDKCHPGGKAVFHLKGDQWQPRCEVSMRLITDPEAKTYWGKLSNHLRKAERGKSPEIFKLSE